MDTEVQATLRSNFNFIKTVNLEISSSFYSTDEILNFIGVNRIKKSYENLSSQDLFDSFNEITKLEAVSINRYMISSFDLNGNFYRKIPNAVDLAWSKILDNAIDKLQDKWQYQGIVYRGENLTASTVIEKYIQPFENAENTDTVARVTEEGYLSTSVSENISNDFISRFWY